MAAVITLCPATSRSLIMERPAEKKKGHINKLMRRGDRTNLGWPVRGHWVRAARVEEEEEQRDQVKEGELK